MHAKESRVILTLNLSHIMGIGGQIEMYCQGIVFGIGHQSHSPFFGRLCPKAPLQRKCIKDMDLKKKLFSTCWIYMMAFIEPHLFIYFVNLSIFFL